MLEETLQLLLRVSPYRCARCDKRFMDSKACAADTPTPQMSRWLAYARSMASRMLRSTQRTPFDDGLKLNYILAPRAEKRDAALADSVERLTKV
jgi:hypothetical protein